MMAFLKCCKRDWMKVNYTTEITSYKYEMKKAATMYSEMRGNLPERNLAFRSKYGYKEDMDIIYSIIQPNVESNFVSDDVRKMLEDAILIMIENGISFANSTNLTMITNSQGNQRRALYEPLFEKYMVYGVELFLYRMNSRRHLSQSWRCATSRTITSI